MRRLSLMKIALVALVSILFALPLSCGDDDDSADSEDSDADDDIDDDINDNSDDDANDDLNDDMDDDVDDDMNDDADDDLNDDLNDDADDDVDDDTDDDADDDTQECIDEDGDTYGENCHAGPDCDDTDFLIHPGAPELPDDGIDQNCDDFDLLLGDDTGVFVAKTGNDANLGTMVAPKLTINAGTTLAAQTSKSAFIAEGDYSEDVETQVSLFGGYESAGWTRDIENNVTLINALLSAAVSVSENPNQDRCDNSDGSRDDVKADNPIHVAIQGFTIDGGSPNGYYTASVGLANQGAAMLANNTINGGSGGANSYGVFNDGYLTFLNNRINGGSGDWSQGVFSIRGTMVLVNNIIDGGSGISSSCGVSNSDTLILANNFINGGSGSIVSIGIMNILGVATLTNNIISGGSGNTSYGINNGWPDSVELVNNNIWGEQQDYLMLSDSTYITLLAEINNCAWAGCAVASSNISENPLFIDPASDDFHLQNSSPCIDTGIDPVAYINNSSYLHIDFEGDPRPLGAGWDIGPDEWWPASE